MKEDHMETVYNTISLKDIYSQSAMHFLYKSHTAVLLKHEYIRLAKKYAERSRKIGARFDNGCVREQKSYEAISDDLEQLFYTIVDVQPSHPILKEIDRACEALDDLAIEAFIRDSNVSSDGN
jgi:hypothetical protein